MAYLAIIKKGRFSENFNKTRETVRKMPLCGHSHGWVIRTK